MLIVLQYKKSEFLGIHETQLPRLNDAADTAASRASDNVASVIDCDCVVCSVYSAVVHQLTVEERNVLSSN